MSCNSLSAGDAHLGDFKGVSGISGFIFMLFLRELGFASIEPSRVGQNDRLRMVVRVTDVVPQLQLPLRGSSFQFATWESTELQVEDIQISLTGKFVDFVEFLSTLESVLNLYPILVQEARS